LHVFDEVLTLTDANDLADLGGGGKRGRHS
jgi:hypothetical protein